MVRYDPYRVAPFGNPRIKAWLAAPRGLSQLPHVLLRLLMPRHPPDTLSSLGNVLSGLSPAPQPTATALPRILGSIIVLQASRPFPSGSRQDAGMRFSIYSHCQRAHDASRGSRPLASLWVALVRGDTPNSFPRQTSPSLPAGAPYRAPPGRSFVPSRSKVFPLERR
jgi:hypothetical protein